jgi:hypothetical protein
MAKTWVDTGDKQWLVDAEIEDVEKQLDAVARWATFTWNGRQLKVNPTAVEALLEEREPDRFASTGPWIKPVFPEHGI